MAELTLSAQPGFVEVPDSAFDAGNPATASNLKALNAAAKFGVVRGEEFWGYYKNGEVVVLPVSEADGYAYSREELRYTWSVVWTGGAPGTPLEGTHTLPVFGSTSGAGMLLQATYHVDQETGLVSCKTDYHKEGGSTTPTPDGVLMVMTHAKRMR